MYFPSSGNTFTSGPSGTVIAYSSGGNNIYPIQDTIYKTTTDGLASTNLNFYVTFTVVGYVTK